MIFPFFQEKKWENHPNLFVKKNCKGILTGSLAKLNPGYLSLLIKWLCDKRHLSDINMERQIRKMHYEL